MQRSVIDREMGEVLTQIALCSHAPTSSWAPTGRSRSSDEPPGGRRPPGDLGAVHFARRYGPPFNLSTTEHPGAVDDEERSRVLEAARSELQRYRAAARERPQGETLKERNARIVKEGEGWSVKDVARHFRCGEREVRRARVEGGREPDWGREPEHPDTPARKKRARDLLSGGHTVAQIARLLGVHRSTVERDLGRAGR